MKKDTQAIVKAKELFEYVISQYPNSDYALDASYKLDLIDDILGQRRCILEDIILIRKNGYLL